MTILVTGGAGYIGSHMVLHLLEKNYDVLVVDNLSTGNKNAVLANKFYEVDICNYEALEKVFANNEISGVIHFAASSLVGESIKEPLKYYYNNIFGTMNLLKAMEAHNVKNLVFSSTAAVYGEKNSPLKEEDQTNPTNPYGETKLAIEKMLKWQSNARGLNYAALRYFNAAGSHESGIIGEVRKVETHLIPIALDVALGKIDKLMVFGTDYETPDGTCIRDYIHVCDLVSAHLLALEKMQNNNGDKPLQLTYNLGSEKGYSVFQIVDSVKEVTKIEINTEETDRRPGDPPILIASSEKIKKELGWMPRYTNIYDIIDTAWKFRSKKR